MSRRLFLQTEKQPQIRTPWFSWETSDNLISAGGTTQGTSKPENSGNVLMRTSFSKWQRTQWWEVLCCMSLFSPTRRVWWGMQSSRAAWAAVVRKWRSLKPLWRWGGCAANPLPWTSGEQNLTSSGLCLVEYYGIKPLMESAGDTWLSKDRFLLAQNQCIPTKKKSGKNNLKEVFQP